MNAIIDQGPAAVFFALVIGHALADYPLQSAYIVEQKSRLRANNAMEWLCALSAHSLIHAGAVWLVTGSPVLGLVEFVLHALIDTGKSEKRFGLLIDQFLHLLCKLGYVIALGSMGHL